MNANHEIVLVLSDYGFQLAKTRELHERLANETPVGTLTTIRNGHRRFLICIRHSGTMPPR